MKIETKSQCEAAYERFLQSISQKAHKDNLIQSVMPESVICTKLIIGNILANPGPMNFKEFHGFLYTDAEEEVIKKIYNMAPEKCPACCKTSHFKPGEYCSLTCIRCNRSACIECYDKDKSNLFSTTMFNKTIHFACNECADAIRKENEIEEAFKKKACLKKSE